MRNGLYASDPAARRQVIHLMRHRATRFAMDPSQGIDYLVGKTQIETLVGAFHDRLLSYGTVPYSTIRYEWLGDDAWLRQSLDPLAPQPFSEQE